MRIGFFMALCFIGFILAGCQEVDWSDPSVGPLTMMAAYDPTPILPAPAPTFAPLGTTGQYSQSPAAVATTPTTTTDVLIVEYDEVGRTVELVVFPTGEIVRNAKPLATFPDMSSQRRIVCGTNVLEVVELETSVSYENWGPPPVGMAVASTEKQARYYRVLLNGQPLTRASTDIAVPLYDDEEGAFPLSETSPQITRSGRYVVLVGGRYNVLGDYPEVLTFAIPGHPGVATPESEIYLWDVNQRKIRRLTGNRGYKFNPRFR